MVKRVWILFLGVVLVLFCSACGVGVLIERYHENPPEYRETVKYCLLEDGMHYREYMDAKYFQHDNILAVTEASDYIYLGWSGNRWGYIFQYYAPQAEVPMFIFEGKSRRTLYLREDFDYRSELFVVDGTDAEIVFSEAFPAISDKWVFDGHESNMQVLLRSKTVPQLQLELYLAEIDDTWCGICRNDRIYTFSEELLSILAENEIIPQ